MTDLFGMRVWRQNFTVCGFVAALALAALGLVYPKTGFAQTAPKITIGAPSKGVVKASDTVTYTVTYSGVDTVTLKNSDVTLDRSLTAGGPTASSIAVSGSGITNGSATRTVTLSGFSGNGTLGIKIASGSAKMGTALASAAIATGKITVDTVPPTFTIKPPTVVNVRSASSVSYAVTYAGAANVSLSDATKSKVTLTPTGNAAASVSVAVTGPSTRTITLSSFTGNGTLTLALAADTATDAAGNSADTSALQPVASILPTLVVDNTPPGISVSSPSTANAKSSSSVTYTVTYSGASQITLQPSNVTVTKPQGASANVSVSGSGTTTRTVTLSGFKGNGDFGISIAPGTARDLAGNLADAPASPSGTFTVDTLVPVITVSSPSLANAKSDSTVTYTVSYFGTDNITLATSDISLKPSGTATAAVEVSGSGTASRTITLSRFTGNGRIGLAIKAGTGSDVAGNLTPAVTTIVPVNVDTTDPVVTVAPPSILNARASSSVTFRVSFSGASTVNLTGQDVALDSTGTATAIATVTGTGLSSRTVTLTSLGGDGTVAIRIPAGVAVDLAGNPPRQSRALLSRLIQRPRPSRSARLPHHRPRQPLRSALR
ncbi:hypothetical protein EBZ80_09355 [bacterium]|nr:hypothetical protein [bacterium]